MLVKQKAGMHPTDVTCSRQKLVRTYTLCEHENKCLTSFEPVGPCNSHGRTESVCVCVCVCVCLFVNVVLIGAIPLCFHLSILKVSSVKIQLI